MTLSIYKALYLRHCLLRLLAESNERTTSRRFISYVQLFAIRFDSFEQKERHDQPYPEKKKLQIRSDSGTVVSVLDSSVMETFHSRIIVSWSRSLVNDHSLEFTTVSTVYPQSLASRSSS